MVHQDDPRPVVFIELAETSRSTHGGLKFCSAQFVTKRVLFICVKNSGRSQMAEGLLRMADGAIECHSAGLTPGKEVHPNAVKVMSEFGYDLTPHRPKHVSALQTIKFDMVAKMDVPETEIDGQLSAKWIESWDVPDPADGGLEEYRKVRDLLVERVERAFGKSVPIKK